MFKKIFKRNGSLFLGVKIEKELVVTSLVRGFFTGIGTFLGATLGIALLLFILSRLELVPIVGNFVKSVIEFVQANRY